MHIKDFFTKYGHLFVTGGVIIFLLTMYIFTLAPTIVEIDSGELTTAQITLSIAHPTGYPLFSMLGYLYSKLPIPLPPAYKMNLLAAMWCAFGAGLFVIISRMLFRNIELFCPEKKQSGYERVRPKRAKQKEVVTKDGKAVDLKVPMTRVTVLLSTAAGALMMGLSKTFWAQSTSVEVYSLHIFLILTVIWALTRAYIISKRTPGKSLNAWLIVAVTLAFSFSNHMSTLFIVPAAAYLYFSCFGFNKSAFILIGKMLLVFTPLLILLYSYLPIRGMANPVLNWSNPVNLEQIIRHVSGWQYRTWLFSSFDAAEKQFGYFTDNFLYEYNISTVFFAIGLIYLLIRARKLFIFLFTAFAFCILYSINYDIKDIDTYFLLAYISMGFFSTFGIAQVFGLLHDKKIQYGLGLTVAAVFIGVQIYFTAEKVDAHDVYTFEDYTTAALQSTGKDAIIISYQWDYLVAPAYYVQNILHIRPDVKIIDKELLRRSWYFNQMKTNYAEIIAPVEPTIDSFLIALKPFEEQKLFNANLLEHHYRELMTGLVGKNIETHPVYLGMELVENEIKRGEMTLPEGYTIIPDLFCYRVVKEGEYTPAADPNYKIRFPKEQGEYTEMIHKITSSMLIRRSIYEIENGKIERAKVYVKKLKTDFPDVELPKEISQFIAR